ncbi:hypothetical protein GCM10008940_34820 [Microbulbifer agarilyticus]
MRSEVIEKDCDGVNYETKIEYKYSVAGIDIISDVAYLHAMNLASKSDAMNLQRRFPVGKIVSVSYNEKIPSESVLITSFTWLHVKSVISFLVISGLALVLIIAFLSGLGELAARVFA